MLNIARIRNENLKYLLYGSFRRSPKITVPQEKIILSKLSIYAGRKDKVTISEKTLPAVYHAAWKSEDGMLGITLASISNETHSLSMHFKADEYELSTSGKIYLSDKSGRKEFGPYKGGVVKIEYKL